MNRELFNMVERLANLLRSESRTQGQSLGLQPVQHDALYYLSMCNRYSDTPIAVTEFLGLTKGTVSQTLKILESKQLIRKEKDKQDKRVTHLMLTKSGKQYIDDSTPPSDFTLALEQLDKQTQSALSSHLQKLLQSYQGVSQRKGFGVCQYCRHNQSKKGEFICGLTNEALSNHDIRLICREFDEAV